MRKVVETGITIEEFNHQVLNLTNQGVEFVTAVYGVHQRLRKRAAKKHRASFACHKGCHWCCLESVCVCIPEWDLIQSFLREQDLLTSHHDQLVAAVDRFRALGTAGMGQMEQLHASIGTPCVFLGNEGECMIYPARPIVCRNTLSTRQCQGTEESVRTQMFYDFDIMANNLILDFAKTIAGEMHVTPLFQLLGLELGE